MQAMLQETQMQAQRYEQEIQDGTRRLQSDAETLKRTLVQTQRENENMAQSIQTLSADLEEKSRQCSKFEELYHRTRKNNNNVAIQRPAPPRPFATASASVREESPVSVQSRRSMSNRSTLGLRESTIAQPFLGKLGRARLLPSNPTPIGIASNTDRAGPISPPAPVQSNSIPSHQPQRLGVSSMQATPVLHSLFAPSKPKSWSRRSRF